MKVTIERELTPQDILDISVTALEGGIGYWAVARDIDLPEWLADTGMYDDRVLFRVVPQDEIHIERDSKWLDVTPEVIARGIGLVMKGVPRPLSEQEFISGEPFNGPWEFEPRLFADMEDLAAMDADEADWVIQLGLFGTLVYG